MESARLRLQELEPSASAHPPLLIFAISPQTSRKSKLARIRRRVSLRARDPSTRSKRQLFSCQPELLDQARVRATSVLRMTLLTWCLSMRAIRSTRAPSAQRPPTSTSRALPRNTLTAKASSASSSSLPLAQLDACGQVRKRKICRLSKLRRAP